jgi:hypothetical protein
LLENQRFLDASLDDFLSNKALLTPGIFQTHPASCGFCPETSHPSGDMAK